MTILVTGGAGYIGSYVVKLLTAAKHQVIVLDNLSNGHREAIGNVVLEQVDLCNQAEVMAVFDRHPIDVVLHFAALIAAGESVTKPADYIAVNLIGGFNLLEAMRSHEVQQIVFSSTAAVYGNPQTLPITEETPRQPTNPYGRTKLEFEELLKMYETAYGLQSIVLRYFNAAGADPDGQLGDDHREKTHLISVALAHALGQTSEIAIFGTDYPTPDGTTIRDYIHIHDLGTAHVLALDYLQKHGRSATFNLGTDRGYSVREVLRLVETVTGKPLKVREAARRPGDPAQLVASSTRARQELGWEPRYLDLAETIQTAWAWLQAHPNGYQDSTSL